MKKTIALVSVVLVLGVAWNVSAQETREDSISALKQQLMEIELKQTELRMRLEELDGQLKPECIERALAGIGSTHPEELREHRRKLLTIERDGLQAQFVFLDERHGRIESDIAAAETAAYLKYAQPTPTSANVNAPARPTMQTMTMPNLETAGSPFHRLLLAGAKLVIITGGLLLVFVFVAAKSILRRRIT